MIPAGQMRERVTLQSATESRDSHQGVIQTWADWPTSPKRWAMVEVVGTVEILDGERVQPIATHRVVMRYESTLTPRHRMVWRGKTLNVESVGHDAGRWETTVLCREAVN